MTRVRTEKSPRQSAAASHRNPRAPSRSPRTWWVECVEDQGYGGQADQPGHQPSQRPGAP